MVDRVGRCADYVDASGAAAGTACDEDRDGVVAGCAYSTNGGGRCQTLQFITCDEMATFACLLFCLFVRSFLFLIYVSFFFFF